MKKTIVPKFVDDAALEERDAVRSFCAGLGSLPTEAAVIHVRPRGRSCPPVFLDTTDGLSLLVRLYPMQGECRVIGCLVEREEGTGG